MGKKVSLKDIAKEVGVSTALVSYVLNNLKEGRISKEIAARIRETARRLNYRPNHIAKSLKTSRTHTIGLIVADISNPFSSSLARIIEDEADKANYTVIFGSSDENAGKSAKLIDTLVNRQVDGLIISPPDGTRSQIEELNAMDTPVVLLDRYFPELDTDYIILDNLTASRALTSHLADNGCGRIGLITYRTALQHLIERKQGYVDVLNEKTPGMGETWIREVDISNDPAETEDAVRSLLSGPEPVEGLIFASNMIAANALRFINTLPLSVPQDLAVATFDETPALQLFYSPLTCIRQPLDQMGQLATSLLLDRIHGREKGMSQMSLPPELVIRNSSLKGMVTDIL